MDTVLTFEQHFLFITLTSFIAILGGLILWLGFIFMGIISRRYEQAYGIVTHWQFQWIAPAGFFVYLLMQAVASIQHQNMGPVEQWTGYTLLTWSAIMCYWASRRFAKMLTSLKQEHF